MELNAKAGLPPPGGNYSQNRAETLRERLTSLETRDPHAIIANLLISLAFMLLALNRLGLPQVLYFDETWYVVSANKMLKNMEIINREHPMFAKEMIAAFYWLFGGSWVSARIGSLLFATVGLFAFQRAQYTLTRSRSASIVFGLLVATNCLYFVTSRIAILDPYMIGLTGISLAFFAKGTTEEKFRVRNFAIAGLAMGLSLASKWTAAPVAAFMGLATVVRFRKDWIKIVLLGGIAFVVAATAYFLTFLPLLLTPQDRLAISDLIPLQQAMAFHLSILVGDHPYQSEWWQWPLGRGHMWFFIGKQLGTDAAIILGQNPISVLLSIPAVLMGAIVAVVRRDWRVSAPTVAYVMSLGFWAITHKPNMFLYHYDLPSIFALCIAAQFLAQLRGKACVIAGAVVGLHMLMFIYLLPLMTGIEMHGRLAQRTAQVGWAMNPRSNESFKRVGNWTEIAPWAKRCVLAPSRAECRTWRHNSVDRSGGWVE